MMGEIKKEDTLLRIFRNAIIIFCLFAAMPAYAQSFLSWQQQTAQKARVAGVNDKTIHKYLMTTKENLVVVKLDKKQPEGVLRYGNYLKSATATKILRGRAAYKKHQKLLEKIGKEYGVDPEIIVALWGMETDYGRNIGNISILDALATLSYEGRRSELFTTELITLLKLIDKGAISSKTLRGSWAGAMGQTQFMPSSFAKYAVDYDKDGHKDIWHTQSDVFASIANYLKSEGWQKGAISITPVDVPHNFDKSLAELSVSKKVSEWKNLNVKADRLPKDVSTKATLLALDREAFTHTVLVFENFRILLKWNYSRLFAGAALHMAKEIKKGG